MKTSRIIQIVLAVLALVCASPAPAQFGGLVGKKSAAPAVDVDGALASGSELLGYVTLANDLGMQGAELLLEMYPDEKVAEIRKLTAQYRELSAKRKDGNIDAEQMKVSQDATARVAEALKGEDWKAYDRQKSANVGKAYGALGLMLLADAQAGLRVKPTVDSLKSAVEAVKSNPLKATQLGAVTGQLSALAAIVPALPKQVESATTVKSICSKIAEAEKIQLPAEVSAEKVKDKAALTAVAKDLDEA